MRLQHVDSDLYGINKEIARLDGGESGSGPEDEGVAQGANDVNFDFPGISVASTVSGLIAVEIMEKIKREEEAEKGLKLLDIVSSDNILSDDPDKVIYEDELLRFSPSGVNKQQNYAKWAQITKREFRYFRDRISSAEWLARPLFSIPLHRIARVERVSIQVGKGMPQGKNERGPYQFEIFLLAAGCGRSKRLSPGEEKKARSRSSPRDVDPDQNSIKKSKATEFSIGSHAIFGDSKIQPSVLSGVPKKDKNSYLEYVKAKAPTLTRVAIRQRIERQGQSAWIPSLSGTDTWSSREKIWKTLKTRHVFAHANKADCEKWVFVLNWIIDVIKDCK